LASNPERTGSSEAMGGQRGLGEGADSSGYLQEEQDHRADLRKECRHSGGSGHADKPGQGERPVETAAGEAELGKSIRRKVSCRKTEVGELH
jgi:hypothetical protein